MPLIRLDVTEAYDTKEVTQILDIIHRQVVAAFHVPEGDRYQIVTRHKEDEMILEDTGLGFERTARRLSIQVFSRARDESGKVAFYQGVTRDLEAELGIEGREILFSIFENGDADWSFGFGKAQFLTGEL